MTDPLHVPAAARDTPLLCWLANPDGAIHWFNQAWYDYTGQTREEATGWGWREVHDPEHLQDILVDWMRRLADKRPFQVVSRLRGADHVFRPFLTRVRPVVRGGRVLSWFGSNSELSDFMEDNLGVRTQLNKHPPRGFAW